MTAARRGMWTLADHVICSGSNFVLMILVAGNVSVVTLGHFALLYGFYVVVVELSRAAVSEPLLVRRPEGDAAVRQALADSSGSAAVFGALAGVLLLAVSPLLVGPYWHSAVVLAALLPVLLVWDALRLAFIAVGQLRRAVLVDAVGGAVQVAAALAALRVEPSLTWLIVGWGFGGLVAAVLATAQAGTLPRLGAPRRWLAEYGRLVRPYFVETGALSLAGYAVLIVLGHVAGPADVGAWRAALTLFGPANVVMAAGRVAVVSEVSRLRDAEPGRMFRFAAMAGLLCGAVGAGAGAAVAILPDPVGRALLGESWAGVEPLVPAFTALLVIEGLGLGPYGVLRAMERVRMLFFLRVAVAGGRVLAVTVGAALAGAVGAATASSLVEAAGFLTALALLAAVFTTMPSRTQPTTPRESRGHP
ncbi:hypothetical protein GCM10010517_48740 [Streptosporangium fragile]|uniref:O-antigen/teichoic acid export membrane protein n=1 Tax=Streptosporangium fragile TaxID=46186 RepID=A0ABN3W1I3_9ACTN